MENRNKVLGINKKAVDFFHKIMLIAFLHSSIVAPSQVLIINYINYEKPLPYVGGTSFVDENSLLNENQFENQNQIQEERGTNIVSNQNSRKVKN